MWQRFIASMLFVPAGVLLFAQGSGAFTSLFDGKTLAGWSQEGGADGSSVSVLDGAIRLSQPGGGAQRGWLRSAREYDDFVLRLEYRLLTPAAMSGIYIRSVPTSGFNGAWPEAAYQIQVREFAADQPPDTTPDGQARPPLPITGAIMSQPKTDPPAQQTRFDDAVVRKIQRNLSEWYTLEIEAVGPQVRVRLNGQPVSEATGARRSGHIGLQLERSGIEFRNISIRTVAPAP